ncbi:sugar-binding domain-containing protein [Actinomadura luteofluorescens]|uniref:glycoside hydrolase family 2 protein n=1 Tax=Actinomadura luteofluorescens TaxID=46163 RepID=UPI00362FF814
MSGSRTRTTALCAVLALGGTLAPVPAHAFARHRPAVQRIRSSGTTELTSGWAIRSSADVRDTGAEISKPDYPAKGWLPLSRPETLMAGLLENGRYPNIFHNDNMAKVPAKQFDVNWWYREQITVHPRKGGRTSLVMNGVSGKADLWINGKRLAGSAQLQGSYTRLEYDITGYVRDGANAIALDVSRNDADITKFDTPMRYLTQNQVDWNPMAPDQNTGLQYAPQIVQEGPVSVRNAHVLQDDAPDLSTADLTVKADVRNNTGSAQRVVVSGTVTRGSTRVACKATVTVPARATRTIAITKAECPGLHLERPAVWWPYQMGDQPMYHLALDASVDGKVSSAAAEDFGIRTVTSRLTKPVPGKTHGKDGYRQFIVNGKPLVIRGAGWSPDLFLRYSPSNVSDQISYIRNMGLNAVRFEGNFPPDDMFAQLDRAGVLAMPGWQCCALWEGKSSTWSDGVKANASNQAGTMAARLRDHPSVFTFFQGSDDAPDPEKEALYLKAFAQADFRLPQVAAAEYKSSPKLGGRHQGGRLQLLPAQRPLEQQAGDRQHQRPDTQHDRQRLGVRHRGQHRQHHPDAGLPEPLPPPEEQKKIWDPATAQGQTAGQDMYHTFYYADYTRLSRMGVYNTPLWHRYGPWKDAASYQKTVQLGEYEVTRAQFESYIGNSTDKANPSTGIIYWMLNKAWPSLQWSMYGTDFDQPGVYFGAKKANEPVHVMYSYDDGSVKVANLTGARQDGLKATAQIIDLDGRVRATATAPVGALGSQDVRTVLRPKVPSGISKTYFEKLTLTRGSEVVSRNVYWLSTKADQVDWPKTHAPGQYTPSNGFAVFKKDGYADLTGLRALKPADIKVKATTHREGREMVTSVTVRNVGHGGTPALFTRADLFAGGNQVLPIRWSDNDVTLWPGEQQTITARYSATSAKPDVRVNGFNVPDQTRRAS